MWHIFHVTDSWINFIKMNKHKLKSPIYDSIIFSRTYKSVAQARYIKLCREC